MHKGSGVMSINPDPGRKLSTVSLFSGCGGLDLGFAMSDQFDIVLASDNDLACAQTYSKNFGAIVSEDTSGFISGKPLFLHSDIKKIDFGKIKGVFHDIDIVIGGPPCQDFSIARGSDRKTSGITTERGVLYSYFVKALIYLRPKYFVFENVPGLISDNGGESWKTIKEDFQNLTVHAAEIEKIAGDGFDTEGETYTLIYAGVADVSASGVPQKRKRAIIVGVRNDLIKGRENIINSLVESAACTIEGKKLPFRNYPLVPLEVFEGRDIEKLDERYRNIMKEWFSEGGIPELDRWIKKNKNTAEEGVIKGYVLANGVKCNKESLKEAMKRHRNVINQLRYKRKPLSTAGKMEDTSNSIPTEGSAVKSRMHNIPPDENYKFLYAYECWRVEGKNISMIYKRIHPLRPSYTVTARGGGGTSGYHYERSRGRLTNRERARLQTFPDWFLFYGTASKQREMIGNAVPTLFAKSVAESILDADRIITKAQYCATNPRISL